MSKKNLSSVAHDVIAASGITATNVLNTYRLGGERVAGLVDARFAMAVNQGASALRQGLRANLIGKQQAVSGYCVKGVHYSTDRAQSAVGVAVDLASKGVSVVAANAARVDRATNLNVLPTLNRVVMPAAQVLSQVADRLEAGSGELVNRVTGKAVPAKAVATRKLNAATRKAATARKQMTKTATQQVSKIIADTATDTSNAARRVARKTQSVTAQVNTAVAGTATKTSNAARRVARKAEAIAA
jgi:hypothetical protein